MRQKLKNSIKYVSYILSAAILLSGCHQAEEVPELIEPLAMSQTFRPVERRNIGTPKILVGHYVPHEYCHFYKKATTLKKITCDIGQYVNKGDILAYADVEKMKEELEETKSALNLLIETHALKQPIHANTMKSMEAQGSACECLEDAERINTQMGVEKENYLYDEQLFIFMQESYEKEIVELEKLIKDSTLRAKSSGYVTYVKNTGDGNKVNVNENIVIVSDYQDTHIEVTGLTTKGYKYKDFAIKYAKIAGREVGIEEYNYTSKELAYAKAQECFPNMRFKLLDEQQGEPGDFVLLYFFNLDRKQVLAVGNDSTNVDEKGNYVYVKGNGGELEKRYFEPGTGDQHYQEVKSGLNEGELVLYVQDAAIPSQADTYEITLKDYEQTLPVKRYQRAETINTAYFTPCDGKVKSILVSPDDQVKKGDVLAIIDSAGGKAKLVEAENAINHLKMDYLKRCMDLDKQVEEMQKQTAKLIKAMEWTGPGEEGSGSEYKYRVVSAQRTMLECEESSCELQKEIARVEYESALVKATNTYNRIKKNNSGTGEYTIVATDDGIVNKIYAKVGITVKEDEESSLLLSCSMINEDKVSVSMSQNKELLGDVGTASVDAGRKLTFSNKDLKLESTCIGTLTNNKSYVFTEENKTYVTTCNSADQKNSFIASINEPSFFQDGKVLKNCDVMVDVVSLKKVVVIPETMLYSEKVKLADEIHYYVWKVVDGELVKQYVTTATDFGIRKDNEIVILDGLSEGDVLAGKLIKQTQ